MRLTSGCFAQMGFDTTVITDNMVAYSVEREGIDLSLRVVLVRLQQH